MVMQMKLAGRIKSKQRVCLRKLQQYGEGHSQSCVHVVTRRTHP